MTNNNSNNSPGDHHRHRSPVLSKATSPMFHAEEEAAPVSAVVPATSPHRDEAQLKSNSSRERKGSPKTVVDETVHAASVFSTCSPPSKDENTTTTKKSKKASRGAHKGMFVLLSILTTTRCSCHQSEYCHIIIVSHVVFSIVPSLRWSSGKD